MPTKRVQNQATARNEEPQFQRAVPNPAGYVNPRRPVNRPKVAEPVTGNPIVGSVTLSQNPRGGF